MGNTRVSNSLHCRAGWLGLMTGWQNCNKRRGALSTLTSKLWKERATSPSSEAQYWCTAATTRNVFARILAFEGQSRHCSTCFIGHWLSFCCIHNNLSGLWLFGLCFLKVLSTWPSIYYATLFHPCHVFICSRIDLSDLNRRCLLKYIKRETNTNYCNLLDILCYCGEVHIDVGFWLQNLDLDVAQNSIEWLVSFKLS